MSIDDRDKNEEIKEEQPIVQEHIKPNYKRKLKKLLEVAVLALVAGLIFGLAVRLVLGDRVKNILRSDEEQESVNKDKRSEVTLRPSLTSNEQKTTPAQTGKQPISFVIDEGSDRQPDDTSAKTADKSSVSDAGHSDKNEKATEKPENDVPESGKTGNEISGDNKQENETPENNTADGNPVSVTSDVTPVPDDGKGKMKQRITPMCSSRIRIRIPTVQTIPPTVTVRTEVKYRTKMTPRVKTAIRMPVTVRTLLKTRRTVLRRLFSVPILSMATES